MRPLRLILDGFGSYRHLTDLDFSDVDFFALVGPTGSGKSTVIDGICFALYGTAPRWGRANAIADALAPSANKGSVCLIFEVAGNRYVALRVVTRNSRGVVTTKESRLERLSSDIAIDGPMTALLEASEQQIAEGSTVTDEVSKLLGLSYEHFTQSVLLPQGRFAEFLQATPGDRQQLLVELLAYGVYGTIGERARERAKLAANTVALLQGQRAGLSDASPESEAAARESADELAELARTVQTEVAALADLRSGAQAAIAAAQANRSEIDTLAAVNTPADVPTLAGKIETAAAALISATEHHRVAQETVDTARDARDVLGSPEQLHRWRDTYSALDPLRQRLAAATEAADAAGAEDERARAAHEAAAEAVDQAVAAHDAARHSHVAADLAKTLHVGDDCPVCQQPVRVLPDTHTPADLAEAEKAVSTARAKVKALAQSASSSAKAAAAARSTRDGLAQQVADAETVVDGAPEQHVVLARLAAIDAADSALSTADVALRHVKRAMDNAAEARKALAAAEQRAVASLSKTRDTVVALGAPPLTGRSLAGDWKDLTEWAQAEAKSRRARQASLDAAAAPHAEAVAAAGAEIVALLARHGIEEREPTRAEIAVERRRTEVDLAIKKMEADREQAAKLDGQIAATSEQASVAQLLGTHLSARRFETWLCGEALDALITEASATLMELSGGQYELARTDRNELFVIDYDDAGTRRPVHTLSGGETFQASLSLALALSKQVVGLSAGRRDLNSMFLDEGFGTLDENTLDTVAGTLERLAADNDRMIGIVTHVPALAERVPIQFAVTREGTSSRVTKVRQ